jgi:hypothetical protein
MPSPNMRAIQTVTVGAGGASTIDFTSIPQTYTDLQIVLSIRTSAAAAGMLVSFNGSTSNLSSRYAFFDGGSSVGSTTNATQIFNFGVNYSGTTASTFGNATVYIANYTSNAFKAVSIDGGNEDNGSNAYQGFSAGLWSNTAAITSVTITPQSGTLQQFSTATLYGVTKYTGDVTTKAIGGTVTGDSTYWYHTFTSTDIFTPTQSITADCLIIAGGAGGSGAGGGAGGLRQLSGLSLTAINYPVIVGAGGAGANPFAAVGGNGNNSSALSYNTTGGGGGAGFGGSPKWNGNSGGSGGGATPDSGSNGNPGSGNAGGYAPVEGYAGGNSSAGNPFPCGGGGGSGGIGGAGTGTIPGNGGIGSLYSAWASATSTGVSSYYAGGGGARGASTGGAGGGGDGVNSGTANAGTMRTGSGGGGSNDGGGNGGSGLVIIRYAK